jgi:hypothetical protein
MNLLYLVRSGLGIPDYWHPHLEIQTDFLSGRIGRYPVSMDAKADYPGQLDEEGMPIVFLGARPCVLPVAVALYGLGNHDAFIRTRDKRYHRQLIHALRWLENHYVPLGEGIGWPNEIDLPVYGLQAPWFSGLVQGLALSLFVRANQLDSAGHWSRLAYQTWLGYHVSVEDGGFCRNLGEGVIYEEYPGPELDCVFNGMCAALVGLWEGWQSGTVGEAEVDFYIGVSGLRSCLPRFVHGRWSLYSLNQCLGKVLLASPYYQRCNGLLAQVVGLMAKESELQIYGERWLESSNSVARRIGMSLRIGLDRYLHAPALLHADKSKNS